MSKTINFFDADAVDQADKIYRDNVNECARDRKDVSLSNRTASHAQYILGKMLEYGSHVRLWTNHMPREVDGIPLYSNPGLLDAARKFLARDDTRLDIIVDGRLDLPDEAVSNMDHPFLNVLWEHDRNDQVLVCHITRQDDDEGTPMRGYAVMDESGYRVEVDDDSRAVVNFGDSRVAKSLADSFDGVIGRAKP